MLIYKFTVREFDIILINHRIVHGGVNLDMTKQALHLLHRHTFVYSHSSQGTAELMRVNTYDFCQTTDFAQTGFHARNLKPFMRFCQRNKKCFVPVFYEKSNIVANEFLHGR